MRRTVWALWVLALCLAHRGAPGQQPGVGPGDRWLGPPQSQPGPADLERALERLADSDGAARERLATYLGALSLGRSRLEARVAALSERALSDPRASVRRAAAEALATMDQVESAAALAALLPRLAGEEQARAAEGLAAMLRGGPALEAAIGEELARRAAGGGRLEPEAFGELLVGLGSALAESGEQGLLRERLGPLVAGLVSPAEREVQGARRGVENALARWIWLERADLARAFLEQLATEGVAGHAMVLRAAAIALAEEGDALGAMGLARAVGAAARPPHRDVDLELAVRARLVEAAAHLARREAPAALVPLAAARALATELVAARLEFHGDGGLGTRADGEAALEARRLAAQVDLWELLCELDQGLAPESAEARRRARGLHLALLRLQARSVELDGGGASGSWDDLLEGEYSPRRLLGLDDRHPALPRSRWLALQRTLGRTLAAAAPAELPGFLDGAAKAASDEPLGDPERLAAYQHLRRADIENAERRAAEDRENRWLWLRQVEFLREQLAKDETEGSIGLLTYRAPSTAALSLSIDLRGDGDPQAALELARAMQADMEGGGGSALWREWVLARLALAVGAALTDLSLGAEAEAELKRGVARLEALEGDLTQRLLELDEGRAGPFLRADGDVERRRLIEGQIELTRGFLADAFVSLAVNANVRLDDAQRAVAYFERAFALRQGDFMVVLLACYRARVGRDEEARALLQDVHDAPALHYNKACAYALLGEVDLAIQYLEWTFESSARSPGARARQKEWAKDDPDLRSLREHPRFLELTRVP